MKYINEIKNYVPYNEQEVKDKEMILYYMDNFDDILTRNNKVAHLTSSAFILNKTKDKVLMAHHNIYNSWSWTGGHADGEADLLSVALREAKEETGIKNIQTISSGIFALDILPVLGHIKKESYVSAHVHLSIAYLIEADENEVLTIQEEENSNVKWVPIDKVIEYSNEPHMKKVYSKVLSKIKEVYNF